MTKKEMLDWLRGQPHEVNFEGSRLSGPESVVSVVLADSLEATLPDDEVVRFGVETSAFGQNWAGSADLAPCAPKPTSGVDGGD